MAFRLQQPSQNLVLMSMLTVQSAQLHTVIALSNVKIEETNFNQPDPAVIFVDKSNKKRYKFLSEKKGDKRQLMWFYNDCKGTNQQNFLTSATQASVPPSAVEDAELAMAVTASIRSALAKGVTPPPGTSSTPQNLETNGWGDLENTTYSGWGPPEGSSSSTDTTNGWSNEPANDAYKGLHRVGLSCLHPLVLTLEYA